MRHITMLKPVIPAGLVVTALVFSFLSFSPYRKLMPGPSPGEMLILAILPFIVVRFACLKVSETPNLFPLGLVALVLLYTGALLQTTDVGLTATAFKMPFQWTLHAAVFCGFYLWLKADIGHRLPILERGLILLAVACSLLCVFQMILGPIRSMAWMPWGPSWTVWYTRWGFRTYGCFDNPLLTGVLLSMIWPLALHRAQQRLRKTDKLACALILLGVILTGSRSCVLVLFLFGLIQMGPRLKFSSQMIMGLLALGCFVLILLSPMGERFRSAIEKGSDANLSHRIHVVEAGLAMISDQPLLGVGPGMFPYAYAWHYKPILSQDDPSSYTLDNTIFQLTTEVGLPFGAVCLVIFGYLLSLAFFRDNQQGRPLVFVILVYGLLSMMVALYSTPVMWLLMIIFAIIEARYRTIVINSKNAELTAITCT